VTTIVTRRQAKGIVMPFEDQYLIKIEPVGMADPKMVPDPISTPEEWTWIVRNLLQNKIAASTVGAILLRSIRYHGRWVRIEPHLPSKKIPPKHCVADSDGPDAADRIRNALPFFPIIGAVVRITPQRYGSGTDCEKHYKDVRGYSPEPDEILLHELVHAFRSVSKKRFVPGDPARPVGAGLSLYDNKEEVFAILVANIYASELMGRQAHIRSSHHGHMNIDPQFDGSLKFFAVSAKAFDVIDTFCTQNRGLTKALSQVDVPFNPIRAYYQNPTKARSYSRSKLARAHDRGPTVREMGDLATMFGWLNGVVSWDVWRALLDNA
jgi:hypothetical protein